MRGCSLPVKLARTKYNHKPGCWQDPSGSMFWYSPTEKQFGSTHCKWQKHSYLLMRRYRFWETAEKVIENMRKGALDIMIIILALSTIMKTWKRSKACGAGGRAIPSQPRTAWRAEAGSEVPEKLSLAETTSGSNISNTSPWLYYKAHTLVSLGKCCFSFLRLCVHAQDRMVCAVSSCLPFLCKFQGLNSGCATSVLTPAEPSVAPEDVSRTCGLIRYEHQACKLSTCIHLLKMKWYCVSHLQSLLKLIIWSQYFQSFIWSSTKWS